MPDTDMRALLDARLIPGNPGGIQQCIMGLAQGLSSLDVSGEEYVFLVWKGHRDWLEPLVDDPCRIVETKDAPGELGPIKEWLKEDHAGPDRLWSGLGRLAGKAWMARAQPDPVVDEIDPDLIHFKVQPAFKTDRPSIYEVYEMQYAYFPQYFSPFYWAYRDVVYRGFCQRSDRVAAMSTHIKQDLIRAYGIDAEDIPVIPWSSIHESWEEPTDEELEETREQSDLPEEFLLFPAQTWPHKNHLGLLEALSILEDRGIEAPLVAPGRKNHHYPKVRERIQELGLEDQVSFPGHIDSRTVYRLLRMCKAVVFPTKFEGGGLPSIEALVAGAPIACSRLPSILETAGDVPEYFNPDEPEEMADVIEAVWTDDALRREMVKRGRQKAEETSWEDAARRTRAVYLDLLGKSMTEDEKQLVSMSMSTLEEAPDPGRIEWLPEPVI